MDAPPTRPRGGLSVAACLLGLIGAGVAIVLLRDHLKVFGGDVAGGLLCGGGGRFDCNAVAAHDSAWLLGLPLPLLGLLFYVVVAALAAYARLLSPGEAAAAASAGFVLSMAAVLFDVYLGVVMVTQVGALCFGCLSSYAINLGLAVLFWQIDRSTPVPRDWRGLLLGSWRPALAASEPPAVPGPEAAAPAASGESAPAGAAPAMPARSGPPRGAKLAIAVASLAAAVVAVVVTTRSLGETLTDARDEAIEFLQRSATEKPIDTSVLMGRPAIGPQSARVTIIVAADFQCSFCRALANRLDAMRRERPNDLRVVFLNSPISSKCNPAIKHDVHPSACWLAKAGLCAAEHGRFWEYHDLVFRRIPLPQVRMATVAERIAEIGIPADGLARCVASAGADSALASDLQVCRTLGITTVPGLIINGHIKSGGIYPTTLRAIVGALLQESR